MTPKIFHKGEKVIFNPKDKYTPLSQLDYPNYHAGKKVEVFGKGDEGWDYSIYVAKTPTSRKVIFCMGDELARV